MSACTKQVSDFVYVSKGHGDRVSAATALEALEDLK